jgi:hypothetical protein
MDGRSDTPVACGRTNLYFSPLEPFTHVLRDFRPTITKKMKKFRDQWSVIKFKGAITAAGFA